MVVKGSSVTLAVAQPFTSFNDETSFGNTATNAAIAYATSSGFTYYDSAQTLVRDESFGHYEVVSSDPFTVRYTVNEGVSWSDGVPVDAADLLLAWAANSGHFNSPGFDANRYVDDTTGQFGAFPIGTVYFDGQTHSGLQHVTRIPTVGSDGRSITLVYDAYFVDWQLAFRVGLPAHVVAASALAVRPHNDETKTDAAKRQLVTAIMQGDTASLAALAHAWSSSFTAKASPKLFIGDGPYRVTKVATDSVTLSVNPLYTGSRKPHFERVVVKTITDPLAQVDALRAQTVDIIAPSATADVATAAAALPKVRVIPGVSGTYEHLDLQFSKSKNGVFDDPLVRQAFLTVVPRAQIVTSLLAPIDPAAATRDSQLFMPKSAAYASSIAHNGSNEYRKVDVAKATSLLARAGIPSPTVCILFDPANPRRVAEFQLIADSAALAGFVVTNCSTPDWRGFLGVDGSYDAALFAWDQTNLAISGPAARLQSDSTVSNFSHYSSTEADALLKQLAAETDPAKQSALLEKLDALLWRDAYGVTLFQFPTITAVSDRVRGVAPSPLAPGLVWNLWNWRPAQATDE